MLYAVGIIGNLSWYGADGPEIELVSTPFIKGESEFTCERECYCAFGYGLFC